MAFQNHVFEYLPLQPYKQQIKMINNQTSQRSNFTRGGHDNGIMLDIVTHKGISERDSILPWDPKTDKLLRAVESRSLDNIERLLDSGANINGHGGSFLETPLHTAARDGWVDGMKYLLEKGSSVSSKNHFGQNPLHYATRSKSSECVKLLLGVHDKEIINCQDKRGITPLHDAASVGFVVAINYLLKLGASVKVYDQNHESPLHKAAKAKSIPAMVALLNAGASLDSRDHFGETVLSFTLRHFPGGIDLLLDHCMVADSKNPCKVPDSSKSLEVMFHFGPLIPTTEEDTNQMKNLQSIVELGHPQLLRHVVCESFLLLKWRKVRYLFFLQVVFYFVYAILTTTLSINKFVWSTYLNPSLENDTAIKQSNSVWHISPVWNNCLLTIVIMQAVFISLQQILTAVHGGIVWLMSVWHVFHFIIALLVILVLPPWNIPFQRHLCTALLLLLWTQCMLLIGRFPDCGIYVVMFQRVAKVFVRIFAIYFCLLLAFTFSFYVSMHNPPCNSSECDESTNVYNNVASTFFKTLTMMIGELSYDDDFVKALNTVPVVSHLVFLLFVILVAIILSNLLVALAVNDVQALRSSVHLERLIKQMELVFQMEENFRTVASLVTYFKIPCKNNIIDFCKHNPHNSKVYLMPYDTRKGRKLCVKSNDVIDEIKLKKELVDKILECVHNREIEVKDKTSISVKRTRRSEYNNNNDLTANLQQLETNLMLQLSEKFGNITAAISDINSRLTVVEESIKHLDCPNTKCEVISEVNLGSKPTGSMRSNKSVKVDQIIITDTTNSNVKTEQIEVPKDIENGHVNTS